MNENKRRVLSALKEACKKRIESDFVEGLSFTVSSDNDAVFWAGAHTKDVSDLCESFIGRRGVYSVLTSLESDGIIMADKSASKVGCILWWPVGFYEELKR